MLNKILLLFTVFLAVIIAGTTIAVKSKPRTRVHAVVHAQGGSEIDGVTYAAYKNLGRLRTVTAIEKKNKNGVTIVISPYFSYEAEDEEFFEELSRKNSVIKSIFVNYFSSHSKSQLKALGELKIKEEIKEQINQILVLNKIKEVYFEELNYLE